MINLSNTWWDNSFNYFECKRLFDVFQINTMVFTRRVWSDYHYAAPQIKILKGFRVTCLFYFMIDL